MSARLIPSHRDRLATIFDRAVHELFGAFAGVRAADESAVCGTAKRSRGCVRRLLRARGGVRLLTAKLFSRTILRGRPRPMILELPATNARRCATLLKAKDQGLCVSDHRGHCNHRYLRRHVVAECLSKDWGASKRRTNCVRRRRPP